MSNTIRIRTTPNGGDKYLKVKFEQDYDFIEILSLKISQEDVYRKFCSDYGVIVGRVSVNNGFGVPNAKVSVFIPIDEIDKTNPTIRELYPYETVNDKNSDGVRYNLLTFDNNTDDSCFTPIGNLKNKREVLDNDILLEVYCKYYKFTTTTNHAGDFMIFGVPLGTYTVHVDADVSDMGIITQKPYDLISQGTPIKFFESPTRYRGGNNLDKLLQVKTLNTGVNVQPFWGDVENCEIGITRVDFELNHTVRPAAIFMGSIFGDSEKHSVNKHCNPRRALGELCEQVTSAGSIDMIRKDIDDNIEEFSVDGGRVIDEDGTWAYQIPMNLDYMVTDEQGNLILSDDPDKGIPTRASVRFKIGMDETGEEGRLRTRAKYLVPHNPTTVNEIDYEFGDKTKDSSFRDLYWNKIYSVSNFISRFQKNNVLNQLQSTNKTRSVTAIKDVDNCVGDKTPFPYNRVSTNINPIFFYICMIIKIMVFLLYMLNKFIIPLINGVIKIINSVLELICKVVKGIGKIVCALPKTGSNCKANFCTGTWNGSSCVCDPKTLSYIGCVTVQCPTDDGDFFAPGCSKNSAFDGSLAFTNSKVAPQHFDGDNDGHSGFSNSGLDDCVAFQMAKTLNLFKFDFYNDWVNGALFSFLLKYKKKKRGREVFCEYDCEDFGIASGGVDGNKNGKSDNSCFNNTLVDTTFKTSDDAYLSRGLREGLIKKFKGEFFYAASTHSADLKLFATEIINLGSIFDCDWQGVLKIQPLLIPTTYKTPPDIQELAEDGKTVLTCGMVNIGGNTKGLFFNIDCLGIHLEDLDPTIKKPKYGSNGRGALNIRHICEFGVDIDQAQEDPLTGVITTSSDCVIGSNDINDESGKFFRDVFYSLNYGGSNVSNIIPIPSNGFSTDFNTQNYGVYDFASKKDISNVQINGDDYINFRGIKNNSSYQQTDNSYYFYFGLQPGKTALDKMNERFFTVCPRLTKNNINIQAIPTNVTTQLGSDGIITFTIINGVGPYQYSIYGINGTSYQLPNTGTITTPTGGPIIINNLSSGNYVISVIDSLNNAVSKTVNVSEPQSLYCTVFVSKNATTSNSNDGEITINSVGGGTITNSNYSYTALTASGAIKQSGILSVPTYINNLASDTTIGYTVIVADGSTPQQLCITSGLTIGGPQQLLVSSTKKDIQCYGDDNGEYKLTITNGQPPYNIVTTGPNYTGGFLNTVSLKPGTYSTIVTDSLNQSGTTTQTIVELNPQLVLRSGTSSELDKQCDTIITTLTLYITAGVSNGSNVTFEYDIDSGTIIGSVTKQFINSTTPILVNIPQPINSSIDIKFKNSGGCYSNEETILKSFIALPITQLSLNVTGVNNLKQCSSTVTNTTFNIVGGKGGPYTVNWYLSSQYNGAGIVTPTQTMTTSSVNPVLTNTEPSGGNNTYINITVTEDSGCVTFLSIPYPVRPLAPLNVGISTINNVPYYTHNWSPSGGIGPYTGIPAANPYIDLNQIFTITVTDSVGCTVTKTQ